MRIKNLKKISFKLLMTLVIQKIIIIITKIRNIYQCWESKIQRTSPIKLS
jgi:hypothetical protein